MQISIPGAFGQKFFCGILISTAAVPMKKHLPNPVLHRCEQLFPL